MTDPLGMAFPPIRARGAKGQVLPLLAVTLMALVAVLALAVDMSGAWRLRDRQTQTLELAKESSMSSLNLVKFADDPALETARLVGDALAKDGYEGTAKVWYFELPESATGTANRLASVTVEISEPYRSALAWVVGSSTMTVADQLTWTTSPYSTTKVWRPARVTNRLYTLEIEDGALRGTTPRTITRSELPQPAKDALASAEGLLGGGR